MPTGGYRREADRKYTITREIKQNAVPCSASFCLLAVAERIRSSASHVSIGRSYIAWQQEGRHYRASIEDNRDFVDRIATPFDQGYDIPVGTKFSIVDIESRIIQIRSVAEKLAAAKYKAEVASGKRKVTPQKKNGSPRKRNERWGIVA
jgi:hypothetical protein